MITPTRSRNSPITVRSFMLHRCTDASRSLHGFPIAYIGFPYSVYDEQTIQVRGVQIASATPKDGRRSHTARQTFASSWVHTLPSLAYQRERLNSRRGSRGLASLTVRARPP